ncbi:hypothetical protein ACTQ49_01350 [Luteococcus sp. Sow4_B9]|uniref:hypothetical protein n=1 Tax=Luteococcus sp. Sow4_B9 TaxID=3438792 RepID=UPI003F9C8D2F
MLASDYKDQDERRAVGQALRFGTEDEAAKFTTAYTTLLQGCVGKQNPMSVTIMQQGNPLVNRRTMLADQSHWLEVVRTNGTLVKLFAADEGSTRYLAGDPVGRGHGRRARHDSVPLSHQ